MAREIPLLVDIDGGRTVADFLSTLQAPPQRFVFGDSIPISFRPLQSNGNRDNPWRDVDLVGKVVRIAIGTPAGRPTSGTFTLSYGGDTTSALAYNADDTAIQSAINALASITSAGGVVVTKSTGGAIKIIFNTAGARTAITATTSALSPTSGAEIRVAVDGDGSTREIVLARIETAPAAYAELTTPLPSASASIIEVREGAVGIGAINSLQFTVIPYAGFYTLTIGSEQTLGIPWDADAGTLQAALELLSSVGTGMVEVTGEFPLFSLSFDSSLADIGAITADLTGLVVPIGVSGEMSTNTAEMIELLNGSSQASAKLEIELYDTGDATTWTVLQTDCTIIEDVIGGPAASTAGGPNYMTFESLSVQGDGLGVHAIVINPAGGFDGTLKFLSENGGTVTITPISTFPDETARTIFVPDYDGVFGLRPLMITLTPLTGDTIDPELAQDQFIYLTPAGTLATLILDLPSSLNSQDGNKIRIQSSQTITAITVNAGSGTTLGGTTLAAMAQNVTYSFVYIELTNKWIREH